MREIFTLGDKVTRGGKLNKLGSIAYSICTKGQQWIMVHYDDGTKDFGDAANYKKIRGLTPKQIRKDEG